MAEKWNPRCRCECPENAHAASVTPRSGGRFIDMNCTATIWGAGVTWPCRCSFIDKAYVTGIPCNNDGLWAPLTKKMWIGEIEPFIDTLTREVTDKCHWVETGSHEPIDAQAILTRFQLTPL